MIKEINDFLLVWEPLWLLTVLLGEGLIGYITLTWVKREFFYDADKDSARRQKKTKTTKKTTTQPNGISVVEEATESSEGIPDPKVEQK
jgi:hypothetical protein